MVNLEGREHNASVLTILRNLRQIFKELDERDGAEVKYLQEMHALPLFKGLATGRVLEDEEGLP